MKTLKHLAILLLASAQTATALIRFESIISDKTVDVGDLNLFAAVWQKLYESSDGNGGLSDQNYNTFNSDCVHKVAKTDLIVNVHLEGQWGKTGGLTRWQMRDALVRAMMAVVNKVADANSYQMYKQCLGTVWQEGISYNDKAACGRQGAPRCLCDIASAQCDVGILGHKVPSELKIQTYAADGALLPDNYEITFSSTTRTAAGGCGKYGAITEVFFSFVPVVGAYLDKAVKIACRQ